MEKINKDLQNIKNKITKQNVIIGNSTQIIKQLIEMVYNIEEKIREIYDKIDNDIKFINEDSLLIKQEINNLKEAQNVTKLD